MRMTQRRFRALRRAIDLYAGELEHAAREVEATLTDDTPSELVTLLNQEVWRLRSEASQVRSARCVINERFPVQAGGSR